MASERELEQARQNVQGAWAASRERQDAVMDDLEAAVRMSERVAVVARLRDRNWRDRTSIDLDTLDTVIDFILEDDHGE